MIILQRQRPTPAFTAHLQLVVAGCVLSACVLAHQLLEGLQGHPRWCGQQPPGLRGQHVVVVQRHHTGGVVVGSVAELDLHQEALRGVNRHLHEGGVRVPVSVFSAWSCACACVRTCMCVWGGACVSVYVCVSARLCLWVHKQGQQSNSVFRCPQCSRSVCSDTEQQLCLVFRRRWSDGCCGDSFCWFHTHHLDLHCCWQGCSHNGHTEHYCAHPLPSTLVHAKPCLPPTRLNPKLCAYT